MSSALKIHAPFSATKKTVTKLVDELGVLKSQISDLQTRETEIKDALKESGESEVEGKLFRVVVSRFNVDRVDTKGLIEHLAPSARILKKFTTSAEQIKVTISARQSE